MVHVHVVCSTHRISKLVKYSNLWELYYQWIFLPPFLSFIVPIFRLSSFISPHLPPTTAGTGSRAGGGLSSSLSLCLLPLSATRRPDCLAHCPPSALTLCPLCLPQVRGHGLHQQGVVRDTFAVTYVVRRCYECEQCIHFKSHFCLAYTTVE